ncbi:MAG: Uma2 family endonuclease, partial [Symploca sp. SIO3E6]|nr:Uma2 family endonuclease [Caldora sp. SIO3E6]
RQRWDNLTEEQQEGIIPLCPDFVIELRSKSDNLRPLQKKMQQYLDNGTKLGWLIDPKNQRVEVYRTGQKVQILANPAELSGKDILPGFVLKLERVWQ